MSAYFHSYLCGRKAVEWLIDMKILKGLLMIITAPVILVLTLFVWLCTGLILSLIHI